MPFSFFLLIFQFSIIFALKSICAQQLLKNGFTSLHKNTADVRFKAIANNKSVSYNTLTFSAVTLLKLTEWEVCLTKSIIFIIFFLGQKRFGCQSCYRPYHYLENKSFTRTTYHKKLNSGVSYCIKADRCVRVQHVKQGGKWGGVLQAICVYLWA